MYASPRENEQRRISPGRGEAKLVKELTQARIPGTGRLFKSIDRTLQLAHMRWVPLILKTGGLLHVDILREKTVKESITDINLP
jgi:hypothetical protein